MTLLGVARRSDRDLQRKSTISRLALTRTAVSTFDGEPISAAGFGADEPEGAEEDRLGGLAPVLELLAQAVNQSLHARRMATTRTAKVGTGGPGRRRPRQPPAAR